MTKSKSGGVAGRRVRAPGEEMVLRTMSWPRNLDDALKATANRRKMPITELIREYIAAGMQKDSESHNQE